MLRTLTRCSPRRVRRRAHPQREGGRARPVRRRTGRRRRGSCTPSTASRSTSSSRAVRRRRTSGWSAGSAGITDAFLAVGTGGRHRGAAPRTGHRGPDAHDPAGRRRRSSSAPRRPGRGPAAARPARRRPGRRHRRPGRLPEGAGALRRRARRLSPTAWSGVWVGGGPLADRMLARVRQRGLADRFRWLGHRDDVPRAAAGVRRVRPRQPVRGRAVRARRGRRGRGAGGGDRGQRACRTWSCPGETGLLVPPGRPRGARRGRAPPARPPGRGRPDGRRRAGPAGRPVHARRRWAPCSTRPTGVRPRRRGLGAGHRCLTGRRPGQRWRLLVPAGARGRRRRGGPHRSPPTCPPGATVRARRRPPPRPRARPGRAGWPSTAEYLALPSLAGRRRAGTRGRGLPWTARAVLTVPPGVTRLHRLVGGDRGGPGVSRCCSRVVGPGPGRRREAAVTGRASAAARSRPAAPGCDGTLAELAPAEPRRRAGRLPRPQREAHRRRPDRRPASPAARLAVKVPTTTAAAGVVLAEGALLAALRRRLPADLAATLPARSGTSTPTGCRRWSRPAWPAYRCRSATTAGGTPPAAPRVAADFAAAGAWLARLQDATAGAAEPVDWRGGRAAPDRASASPTTRRCRRPRRAVRRRPPPLAAARTPERSCTATTGPATCCCTGGRVSGVVDWEAGALAGEPLRDVVRFVLALRALPGPAHPPGPAGAGPSGLRAGRFGAGVRRRAGRPRLVRRAGRASSSRRRWPGSAGRPAPGGTPCSPASPRSRPPPTIPTSPRRTSTCWPSCWHAAAPMTARRAGRRPRQRWPGSRAGAPPPRSASSLRRQRAPAAAAVRSRQHRPGRRRRGAW